ncbi:hypothetical protein [Micromonospora zhanjiangensis]|uniref:Uncharacterized protein n=1 Tax=Micromonospora zhanjiangensis TaxID=1522057 RepID=A0ABV8KNM1_9ACTN
MGEHERRRRRLRRGHPGSAENAGAPADGGAASGRDGPSAVPGPREDGRPARTSEVHDLEPDPLVPRRSGGGPAAEDRDTERGLRSLVGSGSSQVSVSAALRARDAARPGEGDLATAEADVVLVRRNWVPREDLPRPPR